MSVSCSSFRRLVERALVGRPDPGRLSALGFNDHLLSCAACRDLLESEEALEVLLASWPRPTLPADLSARLIERLREARRLEELLELDSEPVPPEGLARRVLAGIAESAESAESVGPDARTERNLDAWLDLAGEVQVPVGLGERTARALREPALGSSRRLRAIRRQRRGRRIGLRAAAALLATVTLAGLWRVLGSGAPNAPQRPSEVELAMATPPAELLTALPVLENWDVLFAEDDPALALGMDFTTADEAMLDFVDELADGEEDSNG